MNAYAKYAALFLAAALITTAAVYATMRKPKTQDYAASGQVVGLPQPKTDGNTSIEKALMERRSTREYRSEPLSLQELSQLLWSAQGLNRKSGGRTAPSAGGTYPLQLYVVAGNVEGLAPGVYRYLPTQNSLEKVREGDYRTQLAECSLEQEWVEKAALDIVFTADYSRTREVYGERGERYVQMEVGHASQNVYLQCVSLGCGTVAVGAFRDECVKTLLNTREGEEPLYVMPVGKT